MLKPKAVPGRGKGRLSILTKERKCPGQGEKQKPPAVSRGSPIEEGAHIQNLISLFQFLLFLWEEEGRESCKHTRINRVLLFFCNCCNRAGRPQASNQDEQQDFSQDKTSPFGVSVYFK